MNTTDDSEEIIMLAGIFECASIVALARSFMESCSDRTGTINQSLARAKGDPDDRTHYIDGCGQCKCGNKSATDVDQPPSNRDTDDAGNSANGVYYSPQGNRLCRYVPGENTGCRSDDRECRIDNNCRCHGELFVGVWCLLLPYCRK